MIDRIKTFCEVCNITTPSQLSREALSSQNTNDMSHVVITAMNKGTDLTTLAMSTRTQDICNLYSIRTLQDVIEFSVYLDSTTRNEFKKLGVV